MTDDKVHQLVLEAIEDTYNKLPVDEKTVIDRVIQEIMDYRSSIHGRGIGRKTALEITAKI